MPQHVPVARHDPASTFDRLRIHTSDVWLAVLSVMIGAVVAVGRVGNVRTTLSMSAVESWLPVALSLVMTLGGLVALAGLLWTGKTESRGWTLEQAGWWLVGSAWSGYAYTVLTSDSGTIAGVAISTVLALSAASRALVVHGIERDRRRETGTEGIGGKRC